MQHGYMKQAELHGALHPLGELLPQPKHELYGQRKMSTHGICPPGSLIDGNRQIVAKIIHEARGP